MKKILLLPIPVICLSLFGCKNSATNYPVDFIDRDVVTFSLDKKTNPLLLVVEIREDGSLTLNKIETGTISDLSLLSEKLESIYDDRQKNEIDEREVVIDPKGKIEREDLEKLIESLVGVGASSIRIIKTGS